MPTGFAPSRRTSAARVEERRLERSLLAGMAAGVVGAAIMAVLAMIIARLRGNDTWTPMDLIGASVAQLTGLPASGGAGLGIHLAVGGFWGLLFGALLPWHAPRSGSVAAALIYAAAVWTVMTFGAMPWADPTLFERIHPGWLLLYHSPYALALGFLTPRLRGSESGRHRRRRGDACHQAEG